MSVEAIATVLHHSRATGTAKVVLIGIANHAGDGGSWPSIATLAKYAGVDERSAQRAVRKLEELGEIRVHAQSGGTRNTQDRYRPNRYDILVSCPSDCDRSMAHRCGDDEPEVPPTRAAGEDQADAPETDDPAALEQPIRGDASVTPHAETGVTSTSPLKTDRGDASVASGVTPTSPEPSLNHPDTPQPPASGGPTPPTSCSKPGTQPHTNCRGCGTTNRQLAEQRRIDTETRRRLDEQARLAAERQRIEQTSVPSTSPDAKAALEHARQQLAGAR